jgi:hypothetical protein
MKTYTPANTANLERAILWQYEKAERLKAIIGFQQDFFDTNVTGFWNNYRTNIFNLDTADSFGLKIWGSLVGVARPRYLPPLISEIKYWRGIKAEIAYSTWENGFIESGTNLPVCTGMNKGKPLFENTNKDAGNYTLKFETDRWYYYKETTAIYQQTSANDWYWEGSWEAISPNTDTPGNPSPIALGTGLSYWDNISPEVSGAGTNQVNGSYSFLALFYGIPAFSIDPYYGNLFLDVDGKWTIWKDTGSGYEAQYKAITATDWPWQSGYEPVSGILPAPSVLNFLYLPDDQYRLIIKSRIMLQRMQATMPNINKYMKALFPDQDIYIKDGLDMTISYFFKLPLTEYEIAVLDIDGILPRPTGVKAVYVVAGGETRFGFDSTDYPDSETGTGQNLANFDNSSFIE